MAAKEQRHIMVPADGSEPQPTEESSTIHISRAWNHAYYGSKVGIVTPGPWEDDGKANETVKALDYDYTHRQWNEEEDEWEADLDKLNRLVNHFNDAGYDVTVNVAVAREFESEFGEFLPEKR